jgi:hypothetical protein
VFLSCFLSGHSAKQYFAECRTRQNFTLGKEKAKRSAKFRRTVTAVTCRHILPSARRRVLSKKIQKRKKIIFCQGHHSALGNFFKNIYILPSVFYGALGKFFFFF